MSFSPSSGHSQGSAPIDLRQIRRLFSRPERVQGSSFLRREIASRMHEQLGLVKITPARVLDAGCGEGSDLAVLKSRFEAARVVGVDASLAMLDVARRDQASASSAVNRLLRKLLPLRNEGGAQSDLINADFARLPFSGLSFDVVWSNLALHWHPQPDQVFVEWERIVKVDGLVMFSCFGPATFQELRAAFAAVDRDLHVLPFVDMHDYGDMLTHAGFADPVMQMEMVTFTYDNVERLLEDVRAFGGNPLLTRAAGLTGKEKWAQVKAQLESMRRADGKIPLSFEIIYGHAFRVARKFTSSGEAIIRLDLPYKRK